MFKKQNTNAAAIPPAVAEDWSVGYVLCEKSVQNTEKPFDKICRYSGILLEESSIRRNT